MTRTLFPSFPRYYHAVLAAVVLGIGLSFAQAGAAEAYRLGPQDQIRLKIYEWRASRDAIFEWSALNDQFTVGADGSLFLPFVGEIDVEGSSTSALAEVIGQRLVVSMGLGRQPDVAVEIVQFRPFYIVGHVMQPGEFPYRPDLTVLQALTIAGGLRSREDSLSRLEREIIAGRGDVRLLALNQISLLARKARLQAELADRDEITFQLELAEQNTDPIVAVAMEQERAVFTARREGQRTQLLALKELLSFLEKEIASLETQLSFHDQQIELVTEELSNVSSLVQQGLAAAPREMSIERSLIQLRSEKLSAETALLRARQEMSRTNISILELGNRYANEVAIELRATETQLNEITDRAETAIQLLYESETVAPRLLALRNTANEATPIFTIVRPVGDRKVEELQVTESTPVQPGDTVKVEVPKQPTLEMQGILPVESLTHGAPIGSGVLARSTPSP